MEKSHQSHPHYPGHLSQKFFYFQNRKYNPVSFYGSFAMNCHLIQTDKIPTAAVAMVASGPLFFYNAKFMEQQTEEQANFILVHEMDHLLLHHTDHRMMSKVDKDLSNIAADMIINHLILQELNSNNLFALPKGGFLIPKPYKGEHVFEDILLWIIEMKQKYDKQKQSGKFSSDMTSKEDVNGKPCPSMKDVFDQEEERQKMEDAIKKLIEELQEKAQQEGKSPAEALEDFRPVEGGEFVEMVKELVEKTYGSTSGDVTRKLDKLQKSRKDNLRYIKNVVSQSLSKTIYQRTWQRTNRKMGEALKGRRKLGKEAVVLLDTSGSMYGMFEKILGEIYRDDFTFHVIQCDTKVKDVRIIKSKADFKKYEINGLGGTDSEAGVHYAVKHYGTNLPVIYLTDGYTPAFNSHGLTEVLIISCGVECPIGNVTGAKIRQIVLEQD